MSLREDIRWNRCATPGQRLRWARAGSGYTQEAFAEAAGLQRGAYRKYEADETAMKFEHASPWARKLKISREWLLNGKGNPWVEDGREFSADAQSIAELVDETPEGEREAVVAAIKTLLRRAN